MVNELFPTISRELTVFFVAATPVSELRGSIPLGIVVFGLSAYVTVILSVLGNLLPVFFIYGLGNAWIRWTERRRGFLHRLTHAVLRRSERRFRDKYIRYGMIALPIFVGIPLPMTGAWTGTIAAFLLGIPFRKAFPLVVLGVLAAAVIVTLATTGTYSLLVF